MQYVYVLQSERDKALYTGCTNDLKKRVQLQNAGKVYATHGRGQFRLILYEALINKDDAFAREQWLKTGLGRNHLQKSLSDTLKV